MDLEESWKGKNPAPIEFFHGELQKEFHKYREKHFPNSEKKTITINGIGFNKIVVAAKVSTFKQYPRQNLRRVIPDIEM